MKGRAITIFLLAIIAIVIVLVYNAMPKKVTFSKCISIGNALDAPRDMSWDVVMDVKYFDAIKQAGFDSVRLPVRFSDYAKGSPEYILDEEFMLKIDQYVDYALGLDLVLILDFHHFIEFMQEPGEYRDCFLRVWEQLSERYRGYPPQLVFELLNEPNDKLEGERWNEYMAEAIKIIRRDNPRRLIIVGPGNYNSIDGLESLILPKDNNLMVTFHYYEPNKFTFQGNIYHEGFENYHNIEWKRTADELVYLKERFAVAADWADKNHVPVFLGEFGANKEAPYDSRLLWTAAVREQAEEYGFSWCYWELCSAFGIYDPQAEEWDEGLLCALLPLLSPSEK